MPIQPPTARRMKAALEAVAEAEDASNLSRFFKTGPGEYGEGDRFRGVRVPAIRRLAHEFRKAPLPEVAKLLASPWHEDRTLAVVLLTEGYKSAKTQEARAAIFETYVAHRAGLNNWDLIDISAPHVVGAHLREGDRGLLYEWARSESLWERRLAILSTFAFIRAGDFDETLAIAEILLGDDHDLIHKAVGWMLREVGNRDRAALEGFLRRHAEAMPRTALRYAIEKFDPATRCAWLQGRA